MKTSAPPPDMTKEQARELKQLRARAAKIEKTLQKEYAGAWREMVAIERCYTKQKKAVVRAEVKELKRLTAEEARAKRPFSLLIDRLSKERTPQDKEHAAVSKRIAVLEGRLGS